jgi:intracellular multiplication protein IcmN
MNNFLQKFLFVIICIFGFSACSNNNNEYVYKPKTKLYPMRINQSFDAAVIQYTKKLQDQHIDVISAGEGHLLVIPDNLLFADQSPRLTWESYKILNQVIGYIKLYRTAEITINDFVSPYGSKERQEALSLARSQAVKNYFWSQNVDGRLLISRGQGSTKPIYHEISGILGDSSKNARTEIRFFELIS